MTRRYTFALVALLLTYWIIQLDHLTAFPAVGGDEPWIAAAPGKLATQGIYGSDLFAGYYGYDVHNFQHPPVFLLLQAAVFKWAGIGIFQMRWLPVALGFLVLPLVFALGRQVSDERVGLLAVLLLVGLSLAPGQNRTGMLLLDTARINRYDIAVPVFGLAALWWFNHAERRSQRRTYVISGGLAGLAGLSQMYGVFWLLALWSVMWLRQGRKFFTQPAPYLLLAGFGVIWIPWLMYVATGWPDFLGQLRIAADRFDVLNPRFYLDNLLHEIERYRQLDVHQADGTLDFARPGLWIAALGSLGAAAVWLLPDRPRRAAAIRELLVVVIVQGILFALLLKSKNFNYVIAWWPLVMVLLAWLMIEIWDRFPHRVARGLVALALGLIIIEGGLRVQQQHLAAMQATPYNEFVARLAAMIPLNVRVLGLPQFALGLRRYEYRTWLLPFLLSDPRYTDNAMTLDQALEHIRPDVILIDRAMAEYLAELSAVNNPEHVRYEQYQEFMQRHHAQLIGSIDDATYGQVRLFQIVYTEAERP